MLPIKQRSKIGGNLQIYKKSALSAVDSLADDIQQIVNTTWSIEVDCAALCRVICLSDLLYSRCFGVLHGKFQCSSLSLSLSHRLTHSLTLSLSASLVLAFLCVCAVQESGQRTVWAMLRSSYSLVWACLQWFERVYASESGLPASVCFCRCNFWCSFRCMVSAPRLQRLVWHRHRYQHQLQSAATPRYVWSRPNKSTKKSHTTKPKQQTPKKRI